MKPLTVVSYNIHRCVGLDGRHDPERVAAVIRQLGPDIIALQEVESRFGEADIHQFEFLKQATGLEGVAGPTIVRPDSHYGNAVFSRYPIRRVRQRDLCIDARREPRGALDLELMVEGRPLRLIAAHLGLDVRERRRQVQRLLAAIDETDAAPLLLLGDINEWFPWALCLRRLHRRLGRGPTARTFPARWPLLALDRLWVRPAGALLSLSAHRSPLARVASDHLPLRAELEREKLLSP